MSRRTGFPAVGRPRSSRPAPRRSGAGRSPDLLVASERTSKAPQASLGRRLPPRGSTPEAIRSVLRRKSTRPLTVNPMIHSRPLLGRAHYIQPAGGLASSSRGRNSSPSPASGGRIVYIRPYDPSGLRTARGELIGLSRPPGVAYDRGRPPQGRLPRPGEDDGSLAGRARDSRSRPDLADPPRPPGGRPFGVGRSKVVDGRAGSGQVGFKAGSSRARGGGPRDLGDPAPPPRLGRTRLPRRDRPREAGGGTGGDRPSSIHAGKGRDGFLCACAPIGRDRALSSLLRRSAADRRPAFGPERERRGDDRSSGRGATVHRRRVRAAQPAVRGPMRGEIRRTAPPGRDERREPAGRSPTGPRRRGSGRIRARAPGRGPRPPPRGGRARR